MKPIIFDSSPLINLAMNNLLWTLKSLKQKYKGDFLIPMPVRQEIIDKPLTSKKFKLEALTVLEEFNENILKVQWNSELEQKANELLEITNHIYFSKNQPIEIMHAGEVGAIALALELEAETFVVDERTARILIENPNKLLELLEKKLHTKITVNKKNLDLFKQRVKNLKIIRSTELMLIAYEMGLFKEFVKPTPFVKNITREFVDGLLWALKLHGCSIAEDEIKEIAKTY